MLYDDRKIAGAWGNVPVVVILLILLVLVGGCRKEEVVEKVEVVRPVKIMTVTSAEGVFKHSLPGKVRAARRTELSFKVSGPLVALPVEEGQKVKKGDLIAQIQKRDFQTALDEARARNLEAEKQFRRYKDLYAKKQVSRADYDRYRAARDVARAQLEDARNALKDTSLLAPFDGVITKRYVENFQKVQAKEPIVNLQDITRIEILVDVPELQMVALKNRTRPQVFASFDAIPGKRFPLEVKEYSPQADPATLTYQVVLVMDQPKGATLLPGMTATVTGEITAEQNGNQIIVPAIAVLDAPGNQPYVWVYDPKTSTVHRRDVTIGQLQGSKNLIIKEGLKEGEILVVAGVTQLSEGMKVRPWEKQREGK